MPEVKFQQTYFDQMTKSKDPEVIKYLEEKKQDFQWLQKTIQQRGDTILRAAGAIVEHQRDFFMQEHRPLKPLTMKVIADELEVHESTVSRAVNGKYMETKFGVFELKSFFSQKVGGQNEDGEDISANTIKKRLRELINDEDKGKPLSDQKLVELLKAESFELSRRTVAKYREALKIPSSSKRKRFD